MGTPPQDGDPEVLAAHRADGPGLSPIDPADPAAAYVELLPRIRSPLTLRD